MPRVYKPKPGAKRRTSTYFVLVQFKSKQRIRKYAGIVTDIIESDFHVQFLKAQNEKRDTFVLKEDDISWETNENICGKVPYKINKRGQYVFNKALDVE